MNHHACLLRQTKRDIGAALAYYAPSAHTEVVVMEYSTVTIGDVRSLIATASRRPVALESMLLVVCFESINSEAEQALLKILEEPPETTKFLLLVPHSYRPLPTIASRVFELVLPNETREVVDSSNFVTFMEASYKARLELVANNCGDKKNPIWQSEMKAGLTQYLAAMTPDTALSSRRAYALILAQLDNRGSSTKMLLEELALTLPRA